MKEELLRKAELFTLAAIMVSESCDENSPTGPEEKLEIVSLLLREADVAKLEANGKAA